MVSIQHHDQRTSGSLLYAVEVHLGFGWITAEVMHHGRPTTWFGNQDECVDEAIDLDAKKRAQLLRINGRAGVHVEQVRVRDHLGKVHWTGAP